MDYESKSSKSISFVVGWSILAILGLILKIGSRSRKLMNKSNLLTNWSDSLFRSFNEVSRLKKNHGLRREIRAGSGAYHEIFLMQGALWNRWWDFWFWIETATSPKTNTDTKNDGLERWTPLNYGHFLDIYVRFQGCRFYFNQEAILGSVPKQNVPNLFWGRYHVFKWPICSKHFCFTFSSHHMFS